MPGGWVAQYCPVGEALVRKELADIEKETFSKVCRMMQFGESP